eukprot:COSAG02_NODE_2564_length_8524_cov_19.738398_4_plen_59_part_00
MEMPPVIPATDPRWGEAELPLLASPQRQQAIAAAAPGDKLQQQGQRSSSVSRSVDDHP